MANPLGSAKRRFVLDDPAVVAPNNFAPWSSTRSRAKVSAAEIAPASMITAIERPSSAQAVASDRS